MALTEILFTIRVKNANNVATAPDATPAGFAMVDGTLSDSVPSYVANATETGVYEGALLVDVVAGQLVEIFTTATTGSGTHTFSPDPEKRTIMPANYFALAINADGRQQADLRTYNGAVLGAENLVPVAVNAVSTEAAQTIATEVGALDAAGVRAAIGLTTANLSAKFDEIGARFDLVTDGQNALGTEIESVQAVTDQLSTMITDDGAGGYVIVVTADAVMPAAAGTIADAVEGGTKLTAIKAKTDLITRGSVSVSGPSFEDEELELIRATDYVTADGMSVTIDTTTQLDITGATITWRARHKTKNVVIEGSGSVASAVEPKQVTIEATHDDLDGPAGEYGIVILATPADTTRLVAIGHGDLILGDDWQEETCE